MLTLRKKLRISANGEEREVAAQQDLPKEPFKVRHVDIAACPQVSNEDLARLAGLSELQSLHIYHNEQISDEGFRHVSRLASLCELDANLDAITDAGVDHLLALQNLRILKIGSRQVTDAGVAKLKGFPKLREVMLLSSQITDAGVEHLKGLEDLELATLDDTSVGDKGIAALADLPKLRFVGLRNTRVTDRGLENLQRTTSLQELWLTGTQVTAPGVAKLQAALPNCKIGADPEAHTESDTIPKPNARPGDNPFDSPPAVSPSEYPFGSPTPAKPVRPTPVPKAGAVPPVTRPTLELSKDTALDPEKTYGAIVVKASGITIDGRGAWLLGPGGKTRKEFHGVAVSAVGVSTVTLENVRAKGWETGLKIEDAQEWTVENCDFSDNFHDPAFGWGENGDRGGIVLRGVTASTLRKNKANRVWDGCVLVNSAGNTLEENDFSHASNTCLKLWSSCRNIVRNNVLSHGIRISPGEVHARDSACLLIESGSNDNRFLDNDCTYGGDGVFLRVLNGWVSTGNLFERNDASYANNNCFEAWTPRTIYKGNKANHGSYGFWLGASDGTTLLDNEASYNGDPVGFHNSPHLPGGGHAGIVFMFGPSSHTIARGNTCAGNHGAGIALVGDIDSQGKKWKAQHWIIEQNTLKDNRWGVYARYADWVDLAANAFTNNREDNLRNDGNVTNLTEHPAAPTITRPPKAVLEGPSAAMVGRSVVFDASRSSDPESHVLRYRWDLGDGRVATEPRLEHVFKSPGFYRVGLTVNNGLLSDLAWRDFYAVEEVTEIGTEGQAADWTWVDPGSRVLFSDDRATKLVGQSAVLALVKPYSGNRVSLLYPSSKKAGIRLDGKTHLVFWIKAINENVPAWQDVNPLVTLYESAEKSAVLRPTVDLMGQRPNNEEREGWSYFAVPLAGSPLWNRAGPSIAVLNYLTIGFDSWGTPPLQIWIDGMAFKSIP